MSICSSSKTFAHMYPLRHWLAESWISKMAIVSIQLYSLIYIQQYCGGYGWIQCISKRIFQHFKMLVFIGTSSGSMKATAVILNTEYRYSIIHNSSVLMCWNHSLWPNYKIFPAKDVNKKVLKHFLTVILLKQIWTASSKPFFFDHTRFRRKKPL